MNPTTTIARFVAASQLERIAEPVRDEAVRALVDWLGCCLGGCLEPTLGAVSDASDFPLDHGTATLPGRGSRSGLGVAVLRSAIAADALDFAAIHAPTGISVSVPLVAALLPLAESRAATGADVVHAYGVGAEIACRFAQALRDSDITVDSSMNLACARIGAAAACGKLLGLDAARLAHAIEIATSHVADPDPTGSGSDRSTVAFAAYNGLTAALLAARDSAHRIQTLAGAQDRSAMFAHPARAAMLLRGLGEEWHLARISYKPYPCDSALHAAIEAALGVRARHRLLVRHIVEVAMRLHPALLARPALPAPASVAQARRSIHHAVAVALLDGAAGLDQFGVRRLTSTRVAQMRSRIHVQGDDTLPIEGARIVLRMSDGRVVEHSVRCARGHPARPLSDSELSDKFRSLAAEVLATDQAERVLALAWNVQALADIGALVRASVPDEALDPLQLPGSPLIPR